MSKPLFVGSAAKAGFAKKRTHVAKKVTKRRVSLCMFIVYTALLRALDETNLNVANDIIIVLDSKGLRFLAAVLPFWVEYVAIAEVKVTADWIMVEEVINTPLFVQIKKRLFANRTQVSWVPPSSYA